MANKGVGIDQNAENSKLIRSYTRELKILQSLSNNGVRVYYDTSTFHVRNSVGRKFEKEISRYSNTIFISLPCTLSSSN